MKEELVLTEIPTAKEWFAKLKSDVKLIGLQSGNPKTIYSVNYNSAVIVDNEVYVCEYSVDKWLENLDDGHRSFYIVERKLQENSDAEAGQY